MTTRKTILIIGASGGIGGALLKLLHQKFPEAGFFATFNESQPSLYDKRIEWLQCDVTLEADVVGLAEQLQSRSIQINWLINTVGILHAGNHFPEKSITQLDADFFLKNISTNCLPTLLLGKHFLRLYEKKAPGVFLTISAKVGSIEDNRLGGWYSYRCSKAALNMALKTLSLEFQRSLPEVAVAAVHPGTTSTRLSEPYTKNVPPEKLFSPEKSAAYIYDILTSLGPSSTGRFWSWDGSILPW